MEGGKKMAAVVVLLIVIVIAVVLIMKRSETAPTSAVMSQPLEMIDRETREVITQSVGEWQKNKKKVQFLKE